jgi:hypothetical protein
VDKKMGQSSMLVACVLLVGGMVLLAARVVSLWCLLVVRQVLYPPASCFLPNGDIIVGKPIQDDVDQKNTRLLLDHRMTPRPSNDGHDPPPAAARRPRRKLNLIIFSKGHNIYTTTNYCCCCDWNCVVILRLNKSSFFFYLLEDAGTSWFQRAERTTQRDHERKVTATEHC